MLDLEISTLNIANIQHVFSIDINRTVPLRLTRVPVIVLFCDDRPDMLCWRKAHFDIVIALDEQSEDPQSHFIASPFQVVLLWTSECTRLTATGVATTSLMHLYIFFLTVRNSCLVSLHKMAWLYNFVPISN